MQLKKTINKLTLAVVNSYTGSVNITSTIVMLFNSLCFACRASQLENEEVHVDIDTYDDGDSQSLRESLHWEASGSNNPSPADSTSTTNSTCKLSYREVFTRLLCVFEI